MSEVYDSAFFDQRSSEIEVAEIILGHVLPLVKPRAVVDLGTAVGTWLKVAKMSGVERVLGLDGRWVPNDKILIPHCDFQVADLEQPLPELGRFDLAICTEVLEHLSPEAGARAVQWLCATAPVILFSAAIPGQGGTNHINEQWQSHWSSQFEKAGYQAFDDVRPKIWTDGRIPLWYRQNLLVMARPETGASLGLTPATTIDLVHPELYEQKTEYISEARRRRRLENRIRRLLGWPIPNRPPAVRQ